MTQLAFDERLQHDYDTIRERLQARRESLEPIARRLEAIPGDLVDTGDEDDRAALLEELDLLEQRRRVALIEIRELERRAQGALLAIYEDRADRAKAALDKAQEKSRALYAAACEINEELRSAINGHIPEEIRGDQAAIDLYKAELQGKSKKAWALSHNAKRDLNRARGMCKAAKGELERLRGEQVDKIVPFPAA